MKPLVIALSLACLADSALAQTVSPSKDPVEALAGRLAKDAAARAEAGESLEAFLLGAGEDGKRFLRPDADAAKAGAVAREWALRADAGSLAILIYATTPGTPVAGRVRRALAGWNGNIGGASGPAEVAAFLADAAEKSKAALADPRSRAEIDAAIAANDGSGVAVPERDRLATERARRLGARKRAASGVFGADRDPGSLGSSGGLTGGGRGGASDAQSVLRDQRAGGAGAGRTYDAGSNLGAAVVSGGVDPAIVAANAASKPSASLPANFRRSSVSDVPPPSTGDSAASVSDASVAVSTPSSGGGAADDGSAKIRDQFFTTVGRLVKEGKRRPGFGSANGVLNNMSAMWNSKRIRCFDQAEILIEDLNRHPDLAKKGWTFRIATYTGEGHEANGHYWANAVNKKQGVKTMLLDPWSGEIKYDDSKEPVVIKGFWGWAFGAGMDKIMPD